MLEQLNFTLLDAIQTLRTPVGDWLMPLVTALGNGGVLWIAIGVLLWLRGERRQALLVLLALAIEAVCCNLVLKPLIDLPRPFEVRPDVALLIDPPSDASFPSGHTGAAFAAVTGLWLGGVRRWWVALILAIAIAFSRLYLYVHYPTDILGGAVLGFVSALLAVKLVALLEGRGKRGGRRGRRI